VIAILFNANIYTLTKGNHWMNPLSNALTITYWKVNLLGFLPCYLLTFLRMI